ncbi:hypothetical protein S83_056175, partial [Arachis hypogaea]
GTKSAPLRLSERIAVAVTVALKFQESLKDKSEDGVRELKGYVYVDGTTTMSTHERKASIREFYAVIYLSLLQLQKGVTDSEDKKQKAVCMKRYQKRDNEDHQQHSNIDIEREECGICMEVNSKIVLPNCIHAMCLKRYREWYSLFLLWGWLHPVPSFYEVDEQTSTLGLIVLFSFLVL